MANRSISNPIASRQLTLDNIWEQKFITKLTFFNILSGSEIPNRHFCFHLLSKHVRILNIQIFEVSEIITQFKNSSPRNRRYIL